MRYTLLLLLLLGPILSPAQQLWKNYRREFSVGLGLANCLTDLGGGIGDGGRLKDIDLLMTRPALQGGFRYKVHPRFAFRTTLSYVMLEGNDEFSADEGRKNRNLSFRTHVIEWGLYGEFYIRKEPLGKLNVKNWRVSGNKKFDYTYYIFAGIAPYYFRPTAKYQNKWYALRKLNTQGQGLPGGAPQYSVFSVAFPIGIGGKDIINRQLSIGVDFGMRFTFNDNLDDVSTQTYYDRDILRDEYGPITSSLSDRRIENRNEEGTRGNPDRNDFYFAGFVTLNYKLSAEQRIKLLFWKD